MPSSLTITGLSAFSFATATTVDGLIPEEPFDELEDITSDGADFARHRSRGLRFRPFDLLTLAAVADQSAADALAVRTAAAIGRLASLVHVRRNLSRTWKNVLVRGAVPQQLPGAVIGAGSGAIGVRTRWTLELTERPT